MRGIVANQQATRTRLDVGAGSSNCWYETRRGGMIIIIKRIVSTK